MPSVRLTIIVRLDQAASLDRMEEFVEERRTLIGTDVSVLLSAADGPAATGLFSDLGALAIPFEATAAIGDTHSLPGRRRREPDERGGSVGTYAGGPAGSTSTCQWLHRRKPPTAIRMALQFPGPRPGDHGPSSGMMQRAPWRGHSHPGGLNT